ncbi:hypothetical protein [Paenochrobactrum pullorum]|uniref:hypothetical protein n=1 Tax=Paenochrobactrum pullorum TaxID=1324351 RepID=UPI0035BBE589
MTRWNDTHAEDLIGTIKDRADLYDYLVEKTLHRQAISPAKNKLFDINVARDMAHHRNDILNASTPAELWYALAKLSNTRHDRHLSVEPVEGGLPLPAELQARIRFNHTDKRADHAPRVGIELKTDFSSNQPFVFLSGYALNFEADKSAELGARLISINGRSFDEYVALTEPYFCYSTPHFYWYHMPNEIIRRTGLIPEWLQPATLALEFEDKIGTVQNLTLDYQPANHWQWAETLSPYNGFEQVLDTPSFTLHTDKAKDTIIIQWHGFGKSLTTDVDALMAYAQTHQHLGHNIIYDATRSRGGDFGGYLLQHLSSQPIRINFGDLRLSDAIEAVIATVLGEDDAAIAEGNLNLAQLNACRWRRDWLLGTVLNDLKAGKAKTAAIPFKCAHQPESGSGILPPAPVHFTGKIVMLTVPYAGSHIDQVAAQLCDNKMCHHIGMPLGGFSKTWTHEEVLTFPRTGQKIASFAWSCGNTIRPNGEVLESNPAMPDAYFPITRGNHLTHHAKMVAMALDYFNRP